MLPLWFIPTLGKGLSMVRPTSILLGLCAVLVVVAGGLGWALKGAIGDAAVAEQRVEQLSAEVLAATAERDRAEAAIAARVGASTRIQTVTKEVVREVRVRVPVDSCPLDPAWSVLHNAAVDGRAPQAPGGPDGPAPATDAAPTRGAEPAAGP